MKSKLIWIAIVIALGVYMANSYLEQRAKRELQKVETSRLQQAVETAVSTITERYNAIPDWKEQLSMGERYRMSPVLTIELEKLWLGDRPILFVGSIKDISSAGEDTYYILVEQNLFDMDFMFSTELRLLLTAPKSVIDSFLHQHPELLAVDVFNNSVAIIARVDGINAADKHGEDGERIDVKIGKGRLLEIIYTGNAFL